MENRVYRKECFDTMYGTVDIFVLVTYFYDPKPCKIIYQDASAYGEIYLQETLYELETLEEAMKLFDDTIKKHCK